jgi:hypothetical protein
VRFFFFVLLFLSACGHKDAATPTDIAVPADEATPAQRAQIDKTLSEIESITADLGRAATFRALPILVTKDRQYITEARGACVRANGVPKFLLLRPEVVEFERGMAGNSKATSLFSALLHEIGHCYYGREHDNALIQLDRSHIWMKARQESEDYEENWASLDASVMSAEKLLMPRALERYYVAELIGLVPDRTLDAVALYAPPKAAFRFVKDTAP